MTDASTQRWRAHRRMSVNSGHVISARDQSHLPAVENSHSHSPNADRQLHKHALFLQAVWTSGISSVRRPLNFLYTSLNCTNDLVPTSQPKFRPDALSFFSNKSWKGEMYLSTYLIAKDWVKEEVLHQWQSYHMIRLFWYLHQRDHFSVLHHTMSWITARLSIFYTQKY